MNSMVPALLLEAAPTAADAVAAPPTAQHAAARAARVAALALEYNVIIVRCSKRVCVLTAALVEECLGAANWRRNLKQKETGEHVGHVDVDTCESCSEPHLYVRLMNNP